jgi:4-hydroxythreonine-4-phosphate dehydrogenase
VTQAGALIALTCGDPAGIGPELALKAWTALHESGPAYCYLGDPDHLAQLSAQLGTAIPIRTVTDFREALKVFPGALPVLATGAVSNPSPGLADADNAAIVTASIERAVALSLSRQASAIVTNPINKHMLYAAGFKHPGHTEYLAALCGVTEPPVMMLAIEGLRVVPVTVHLSVAEAIRALTISKIVHAATVTARELAAKFGVAHPRLAIAALNPHAGEKGSLGREEVEIVAPAIKALNDKGILATGPHPVDTLFHPAARANYDAAICMLHDHALIPLKTLDFDCGVNITLGLPIIRTSPDHGTAYDIAGKGVANPSSLIAALRLSAKLAAAAKRSQ